MPAPDHNLRVGRQGHRRSAMLWRQTSWTWVPDPATEVTKRRIPSSLYAVHYGCEGAHAVLHRLRHSASTWLHQTPIAKLPTWVQYNIHPLNGVCPLSSVSFIGHVARSSFEINHPCSWGEMGFAEAVRTASVVKVHDSIHNTT